MKPEESESYRYYSKIMGWADEQRKLLVRTNADQPDQAANAIAFGAQGIGLCRTEHMFFGGDRIVAMREMILANTREEREKALAKLLPIQRGDFAGIFRVMGERPVTIRTLDPPLHEFLPHDADGQNRGRRAARHLEPRPWPPRSTTCTRTTPCSACAAAAWASSTRRSRRCRRAPSSRPPATSRPRASTCTPRS